MLKCDTRLVYPFSAQLNGEIYFSFLFFQTNSVVTTVLPLDDNFSLSK